MSDASPRSKRMRVEDYLIWVERQPGRHELYDGEIFTMQAERIAHVIVKSNIFVALRAVTRNSASGCTALADGVTVRIDAYTAFEPDCTVHCGPVEPDALVAGNPVIVVEVLSPSSQAVDLTRKLPAYFQVRSIQHYLVVDPEKRLVVHHRRSTDEIISRILRGGKIDLDPPGVSVSIADFFLDLPASDE